MIRRFLNIVVLIIYDSIIIMGIRNEFLDNSLLGWVRLYCGVVFNVVVILGLICCNIIFELLEEKINIIIIFLV